MKEYRPRLIDAELDECLEAFGAVQIVGPKWCGKTTTASRKSRSTLYMQDPVTRDRNLALAKVNINQILAGSRPRLIDEWQVVPEIWDAVRFSVDREGGVGMYILTGSVSMELPEGSHTGTGRIHRLRMNTMSLFESDDSNGEVSLEALFNGARTISGESSSALEDVARCLVRGGWPQSLGKSEKTSTRIIDGYCEGLVENDTHEFDGVSRDPFRMRAVLRSISRMVSSPLNKQTIICDVPSSGSSISMPTLDDYMRALRAIHVLDTLPAWNPNLRSRTAIRTTDTVHLCDPAIACHFLNVSVTDLMNDPNTFGLLFESLVVRDLRIYASSLGGDVFHYRDRNGLEADAVIHLRDGRWAAVEVKLSDAWVEDGAASLRALRSKTLAGGVHEPAFLAVVVPTGYAYTRPDGVHVIPIGCLRDRIPPG